MADPAVRLERDFLAHWTRVQPVVTAYLGSCLAPSSEVDDLLQEVAVIAHRQHGHFDPAQDFLAWALGIARNVLRNHRRAQGRSRLIFNDEVLDQMAATVADESGVLTRYGARLRRCLESLSPRLRRLIRGHHLDNLPQLVLAEREAMSHAAVRTALHRGRAQLRDCLERGDD